MLGEWSVDDIEEADKVAARLFAAGWHVECLAWGTFHMWYRLSYKSTSVELIFNYVKGLYLIEGGTKESLPFKNLNSIDYVGSVIGALYQLCENCATSRVDMAA